MVGSLAGKGKMEKREAAPLIEATPLIELGCFSAPNRSSNVSQDISQHSMLKQGQD